MRILVTNDDGVHSPGLDACAEIARALGDEVWIVAPEYDQSGVSHSLSLNDPLRLRQVGERHYAVKGTPTDCVIMGARHLMKEMPDLVLSGVNRGRNVAEDVSYSGTVAGAIEGTVLGVPSFALSQCYSFATKANPPYETAIHHAPGIIKQGARSGDAGRRSWSTSIFRIVRPIRSPASRSRSRASATRSFSRSRRAMTAAAIPISGSRSAAGRSRSRAMARICARWPR